MAFGFFKKKKKAAALRDSFDLTAPFDGKSIALEDVPDEVFSQKILGDGVAVIPADADTVKIFAPVDAQVSLVADTGHAIGLKTAESVELLIHYGLETVSLNGEGFTPKVKADQYVEAGDLLMEVDSSVLKAHDINPVTMIIISDAAGMNYSITSGNDVNQGESVLIQFSK